MLTGIFITSFIVALSGALMPGPLLTVTVSESGRRGAVAGPLVILGHGLLELALVAALVAGLGPVLRRDGVFAAIALFGGAVLLFMGLSMLRDLPRLSLATASGEEERGQGRGLVLAGIVFSLANPYWVLWWASIGLGYLTRSMDMGLGILGIAAFFCGHILADFAWYAAVSLGISRGRHLLGARGFRVLIGACASFLIVFSGWFLYSGLERLA